MSDDLPERTAREFARGMDWRVLRRIEKGRIDKGSDVSGLRRFAGFGQAEFARALGVSVAILRDWEAGAVTPKGPALALLRIVARDPRVLRGNLSAVRPKRTRRSAAATRGHPTRRPSSATG